MVKENEKCPYHIDHSTRISNLEAGQKTLNTRMEENMTKVIGLISAVADKVRDPRMLIAIVGFFGVLFSTAGSIIGAVIVAYVKVGAPVP